MLMACHEHIGALARQRSRPWQTHLLRFQGADKDAVTLGPKHVDDGNKEHATLRGLERAS